MILLEFLLEDCPIFVLDVFNWQKKIVTSQKRPMLKEKFQVNKSDQKENKFLFYEKGIKAMSLRAKENRFRLSNQLVMSR